MARLFEQLLADLKSDFTDDQAEFRIEGLSGYANINSSVNLVAYPRSVPVVQALIRWCYDHTVSVIPRGGGFSYGEIAMNDAGIVIHSKHLKKIINFDQKFGTLVVEPGVTFQEIIAYTLPLNWLLTPVPGEKEVSIGGAIGCNIHGKNSWRVGNFASTVKSFDLVNNRGEIQRVTSQENPEYFDSVLGGLGLIGFVTKIDLQLEYVQSPFLEVETVTAPDLKSLIQVLVDSQSTHHFLTAWSDCFVRGKQMGRGFVERGRWISTPQTVDEARVKQSLSEKRFYGHIVPVEWVWKMLSYFWGRNSVRLLNRVLYFQGWCRSRRAQKYKLLFPEFNFIHKKFPNLRSVYQPHGFFEIHPVIPNDEGSEKVKTVLEYCQKHKLESLLCGLKIHKQDRGYIGFGLKGFSFGIDVHALQVNKGQMEPEIYGLLDLIGSLGGQVCISKDHWLRRRDMQLMHPDFDKFLKAKVKLDPSNTFHSNTTHRLIGERPSL